VLKPGAFKLPVNWIQLVQPHLREPRVGGDEHGQREDGVHTGPRLGGARIIPLVVLGVAVQVVEYKKTKFETKGDVEIAFRVFKG
jgi:hypothetical protein